MQLTTDFFVLEQVDPRLLTCLMEQTLSESLRESVRKTIRAINSYLHGSVHQSKSLTLFSRRHHLHQQQQLRAGCVS